MPPTLFSLIARISGLHQVGLASLSVLVFIADAAPLELQRRLINSAVKDGDLHAIFMLAGLFALFAVLYGLLKLALNIYRSWAGEAVVKWLRHEISERAQLADTPLPADKAGGVEIAMVIAEADPIGGFVGSSVSEPLLQGGLMLVVFGYLVYLQPLMALVGVVVFLPQLILVPMMQGAINRRVGVRVWTLRKISIAMVDTAARTQESNAAQDLRVAKIFHLNMGIYTLKFSLNFVMNLLTAFGTAAILGLGGYYVIMGATEIGTVVAFVTGLSKIASPWGDLVNWYREFRVTQERYRLVVASLSPQGGVRQENL